MAARRTNAARRRVPKHRFETDPSRAAESASIDLLATEPRHVPKADNAPTTGQHTGGCRLRYGQRYSSAKARSRITCSDGAIGACRRVTLLRATVAPTASELQPRLSRANQLSSLMRIAAAFHSPAMMAARRHHRGAGTSMKNGLRSRAASAASCHRRSSTTTAALGRPHLISMLWRHGQAKRHLTNRHCTRMCARNCPSSICRTACRAMSAPASPDRTEPR